MADATRKTKNSVMNTSTYNALALNGAVFQKSSRNATRSMPERPATAARPRLPLTNSVTALPAAGVVAAVAAEGGGEPASGGVGLPGRSPDTSHKRATVRNATRKPSDQTVHSASTSALWVSVQRQSRNRS